MFETITCFLPELNTGKYGEWSEQEPDADGSTEHPYQWPHVICSETVDDFIHAVYSFIDSHGEMGLTNYQSILEEKGIHWGARDMEKLVTKRKQLDDKKVLEAYHAGSKTADEIIEFIQSGTKQEK